MFTLFIICAAGGGTLLAVVLMLTLVGRDGYDEPDEDASGEASESERVQRAPGSWLAGVLSTRTIVAGIAFFGLAGLMSQAAELTVAVQILSGSAAGLVAMLTVHFVIVILARRS